MRVSVVTRTRGRPLLLSRAAGSVAGAAIDGTEWIIVDDGETVSPETRAIAERTAAEGGLPVRVVCSGGQGRSAAANTGLQAASGTWVHLHDDDDTLDPRFLERAIAFLEAKPRYRGVRAMCARIHEEIAGETIRFLKKKPHYPERRVVSLMSAAEVFAYPPIGTVLERETMLGIGGFDERFDVAEDYDLLLRFLLRGDIGTIPDTLAFVHVREQAGGSYANSPISRDFAEEDMLFRNAMLRDDINAGRIGLGWLLAFGTLQRRNRTLLDFLDAARRRIGL